MRGRHRCVVALVKNKADVNRLDFLNYSTLHYACMLGWRDTVEFLLSQGAKTDVLNVLGQNALQLAVKVGATAAGAVRRTTGERGLRWC